MPSTLLAGRYRLDELIATGGMGVVWKGWDELLERPVAVKQLRTELGVPEEQAELAKNRAMREARITARLHHPHAVLVFDAVENEGQPCLIMQYVPSIPLSAVLRQRGTLPLHEAARIGAEVASALAAAHQLGIVHRDVKPGNILIADEDGRALISDFGISHALGDATLTSTGLVHGTPAFLAPEVARGDESSFASDIFSLGSTLYAAVEGAPPFGADPNSIAMLHRVALGRFKPPKQAGPLTPLLMEMLDNQPDARPSMRTVANRLRKLQAITEAEAEEATPPAVPGVGVAGGAAAVAAAEQADAEPGELEPGTLTAAMPTEDTDLVALGRWFEERPEQAPDVAAPAASADDGELPRDTDAAAEPTQRTPRLPTPAVPVAAASAVPAEAPAPAAAADSAPTTAVPTAAVTEVTPVPSRAPGRGGPPSRGLEDGERRRRRRRGALIAAAVAAVAVVLLLAGLLQNGLGGRSTALPTSPARNLPASPHASSAQPTTPSTPSTTPTDTTPTTSTPSATPTTAPSSSSSSSPKSSSSGSSKSSPAKSSGSASSGVRGALTSYYGLLPGNRDAAWDRLTAHFKDTTAGPRSYFDKFWGSVSSVSVSNIDPQGSRQAVATVTLHFKSGGTEVDRSKFWFVESGGVLKIDRQQNL